jgi:MFS family permease
MATVLPTAEAPGRLISRSFLTVSVATMAYFIAVGINLPTLPRYITDGLGASSVVVGAAVAAYSIAAIAARPLIAWFARRYGERWMMTAGALLATGAVLLTPVLTPIVFLLALRMVLGVGEGLYFVGAATIVNDLAPAHRRAEAASYFSVAVFGGLGIGPILGELLASDGHYTIAFVLAGLFTLASGLIARTLPAGVGAPVEVLDDAEPLPLLHKAGLRTGVVLAMAMLGYTGFMAFLPLRAEEVGVANAGGVFLLYSVLVLVLRLAGARIPERIGLARSAAMALTAIGTGLLLMASLDSFGGLLMGTVVLAIGISLLYPSLMAMAVNSVPDHERAAVVATFTMFFEVGGAVGGILLGPIADRAGYQSAFLAGGLIALAGLPMLYRTVIIPRRLARASCLA